MEGTARRVQRGQEGTTSILRFLLVREHISVLSFDIKVARIGLFLLSKVRNTTHNAPDRASRFCLLVIGIALDVLSTVINHKP